MEELPLHGALLGGFEGKFEGGLDDCLDEVAVDTFFAVFALRSLTHSLLWVGGVG